MSKLAASVAVAASLLTPATAAAHRLFLSTDTAHKAIEQVVAADHAAQTIIDGCHRRSPVSVTCGVLEEWITPPTETAPEVIEGREGSFTATLKHDHRLTYIRVHQNT
jgi:hypothetical protein